MKTYRKVLRFSADAVEQADEAEIGAEIARLDELKRRRETEGA